MVDKRNDIDATQRALESLERAIEDYSRSCDARMEVTTNATHNNKATP